MSYSIYPELDAQRHLDAQDVVQAARYTAVQSYADDFLQACAKGDANAVASFAPMVTDWAASSRLQSWQEKPRRRPTVAELIAEQLNYKDYTTEAMQCLIGLAYGDADAAKRGAQALLRQMAQHYAEQIWEDGQ